MLTHTIEWSVRNRFLVLVATVAAIGAGIWAIRNTPLEALPDLSDVQVIVQADYGEQAPRIVEDQVTYPIAAEMLKVPGARTVRGYSFFGVSFVYVIFDDGTDLYWARSRVLEYLSGIKGKLPASVSPTLGPDATGLGWVFQYALVDTTGRLNLAELRALQDWNLRYALTAVPGVSEVATVGGFEKQYQVDINPSKLLAYGVSISQVMAAIEKANADVGAMVMELSEREYMVRGLGYLKSIGDIENVVIGASAGGTPVTVAQVGRVSVGPAVRRGIADLDGRGDAVGGIVVMRFGENAFETTKAVKAKLRDVAQTLPPGVVIRPVYDRSELILRAIDTVRRTLIEETIIVALVCVVFLFHARSALVAILTLPVGILLAFIAMRAAGVGADIMSLGGIAIAMGSMIDSGIVMTENMHKQLERELPAGADGVVDTRSVTLEQRLRIVIESSKEVGPALFFSLLIITVSFIPVFALEGQEGRLFKPLAFTKTFAMAFASLLSVTLVPVTMTLFVRGRIRAERSNPVSRLLIAVYRPVIDRVLRNKAPVIVGALTVLILTWIPWKGIGREFMPPLQEGTLLFMPTTMPGISVARAREILRIQDSVLKSFPEVETVWGKAGRAGTATDPAGLDMFETTVTLRPESQWRAGMTESRLVAEMDSAVRVAGVTNAWTMPIKGRIDMLSTGIRTPVGVKVFGPELSELERIGKEIEQALQHVRGTRSVFAERAVSGYYLDIEIDRAAAARHGLNVGDIQTVIAAAIGGMTVTHTVEGRERYAVRVRYPQELRDTPERLAAVLVPVSHGMGGVSPSLDRSMTTMPRAAGGTGGTKVPQVPLGQVARVRPVAGPMVVRTEDAVPTAWVYVDVADRDIGSFVEEARRTVEDAVALPAGYRIAWSGQYEYMERAAQRMKLVVPATLVIIFLLLYLNFKSMRESFIVMLSLPFALVGGIWFMWALSYDWSVAVAIGFIALAGETTETGVVMLVYLDNAWNAVRKRSSVGVRELYGAIVDGAVERVRPKIMTVAAIMVGLLPVFWSNGAGASVMKRIAAPMIGGMISSTVLTLVVIPAVYALVRERELSRTVAEDTQVVGTPLTGEAR